MDTKDDLLIKKIINISDPQKEIEKEDQKLQIKEKRKVQCGGSTFEIYSHYQLIRNIGTGAFGIVCSGKDTINNTDIAIKKIPGVLRDIKDSKRILREIKLLSKIKQLQIFLEFFDHPHIVKLLDIILPDNQDTFKDLYLVFSLMHTDLQRIILSNQVLCDKKIKWCMFQIVSGIYYMHSANIVHRDLKPNNIFINSNCHIKIGDLNLARKQEVESIYDQTNYVVQRWYRAPEVLLSSTEYTQAIDIWSLGCILAELLGRIILFQGKHHQEQIEKIVAVLGKPKQDDLPYEIEPRTREYLDLLPEREAVKWNEIFPYASPQALDLLEHMLVYNPTKRFTIQQCIEHEYFKQYQNEFPPIKCDRIFDWTFDSIEENEQKLREALYNEALQFQFNHNAKTTH